MKKLIDQSVQKAIAPEHCQDRREFLSAAAMGIASVSAGSLISVHPAAAAKNDEIRPFRVNVPNDELVDLLRPSGVAPISTRMHCFSSSRRAWRWMPSAQM